MMPLSPLARRQFAHTGELEAGETLVPYRLVQDGGPDKEEAVREI